jgi:hypothetical protein
MDCAAMSEGQALALSGCVADGPAQARPLGLSRRRRVVCYEDIPAPLAQTRRSTRQDETCSRRLELSRQWRLFIALWLFPSQVFQGPDLNETSAQQLVTNAASFVARLSQLLESDRGNEDGISL